MRRHGLILALFFLSSTAMGESIESLESLTKRIEELERQQEELIIQSQTRGNPVHSFLRDNFTLGGFFESGVTGIEGKDTDLQVVNSSNILGFNLAADFSPQIHFASQLITGLAYPLKNPHNNPQGEPDQREFGSYIFGAALTQGYVEYIFSPHLKIQAGLGYVPFGQALQQRELVLFWRRGGPQTIRANHLVSQLWSGVHLLGDFPIEGGGKWGYNLYTANPIDTGKVQMMGLGARLWVSSYNDILTAGLSSQIGKYTTGTDEVVGADTRIKLGRWQITSEYIRHVTQGEDPYSYYVAPGVYLFDEKFILFGFGDYSQSPLNELSLSSGTIADPYEKWEYGAGINWLPSVYTRLRLTFTFNDYVGNSARLSGQNRDYHSIDLSVGVAF
jgi:hypothetical protein